MNQLLHLSDGTLTLKNITLYLGPKTSLVAITKTLLLLEEHM